MLYANRLNGAPTSQAAYSYYHSLGISRSWCQIVSRRPTSYSSSISSRQSNCALLRLYSDVPSANTSTSSIPLSLGFSLKQEWAERLKELGRQSLGYDSYEWTTLVQKKFSGGGKASAVDLDIACTLCQQPDQIGELLDLCYKLRHTDNAVDLFNSTEYALFRLLLDHKDMVNFMKVLNDPINFGLFPDEHICCLYLDNFLASGDFSAAARLSIYVVQQELFDFALLNYLSARALLQFLEDATQTKTSGDNSNKPLQLAERDYPPKEDNLEDEISFNEENVRIFRFPWMKVPHSDGHFDLSKIDQLVGKSLEWLCWHLKLAENSSAETRKDHVHLKDAIQLMGLVLQAKHDQARAKLANLRGEMTSPELPMLVAALQIARTFLVVEDEKKEEKSTEQAKAHSDDHREQLLETIDEVLGGQKEVDGGQETVKLSTLLQRAFQPIQAEEEQKLMAEQRRLFGQWERKRREFIESQAQRLEMNLRLEEIGRRRNELMEERELLYFFENRHLWEDKALQRQQLEEHLGLLKKRGELTEDEYAKTLFRLGQLLKEGMTAQQALGELQPAIGTEAKLAKGV